MNFAIPERSILKIKLLLATLFATLSTAVSASTVNLTFDLVWEQTTDLSPFGTRATMDVIIDSVKGSVAGSFYDNLDVKSINIKSVDGTFSDSFTSLGESQSDDWRSGSIPLFSIAESGSAVLNLSRINTSGGYFIYGGFGNTGKILQLGVNNGATCATPLIIFTPQEESGPVTEAASIVGPLDIDNIGCLGFTIEGSVVYDKFAVPEPSGIYLVAGSLLLVGVMRRRVAFKQAART